MFIPLFAVSLGLMGVISAENNKMNRGALRKQILGNHAAGTHALLHSIPELPLFLLFRFSILDFPEMFVSNKVAGETAAPAAAYAPSATYSTTGWLYRTYFSTGGCVAGNEIYAEGMSVNTCFNYGNGIGYKYQLVSGK